MRLQVIILTVVIAGCGLRNPSDLRTEYRGLIEFSAHDNYQAVYRRIVESEHVPARETRSELYTDIRQGRIWFQSQITPFGTFVLIDVIYVEPSLTKVRYYYYYPAWRPNGVKIKQMFVSDDQK